MDFTCPVCGYNKLDKQPYDEKNRGSFDICPCCGFQYGVDDDDKHYTFESYRNNWLKKGAKWFSNDNEPINWDLKKQLKNINISLI
jgi:transcription elongation factor Elf1